VINNFFEVKKGNSQKFHEARNWVNGAFETSPKRFQISIRINAHIITAIIGTMK
jgi:hypothetical protein